MAVLGRLSFGPWLFWGDSVLAHSYFGLFLGETQFFSRSYFGETQLAHGYFGETQFWPVVVLGDSVLVHGYFLRESVWVHGLVWVSLEQQVVGEGRGGGGNNGFICTSVSLYIQYAPHFLGWTIHYDLKPVIFCIVSQCSH